MAFRRDAWEQVDGYPEYIEYAEDTAFNLRLKEAGFRFQFEPDARVRWRVQPSLFRVFRQFFRYAGSDGELGVGHNHSPMLGRLGNGEMRITFDGELERYYIEGGFVEVKDNIISLLTQRAVPAETLDVSAAKEQLEAARKRPANTPELMAVRDRAVSQARAQLRVAQRASF